MVRPSKCDRPNRRRAGSANPKWRGEVFKRSLRLLVKRHAFAFVRCFVEVPENPDFKTQMGRCLRAISERLAQAGRFRQDARHRIASRIAAAPPTLLSDVVKDDNHPDHMAGSIRIGAALLSIERSRPSFETSRLCDTSEPGFCWAARPRLDSQRLRVSYIHNVQHLLDGWPRASWSFSR